MLEINKEYTYKQIITELEWTHYSGGCSKKAQIKEIESAFEFYHPINKKTHKEKKSYIFTKQLREPVEPDKSNCGGGNNIKNIKPMIDYVQAKMDKKLCGEYYSMTSWYCDILDLFYKSTCNIPYLEIEEIKEVCKKNNISDEKLFCKYISLAKSEMKDMFIKSLSYIKKKNIGLYSDGYIFIYQLGKRMTGQVYTTILNDLIKQIETEVCNEINEKYELSKKLEGRRNLLVIYRNKNLLRLFEQWKIHKLMNNNDAIQMLNAELEGQYENYYETHSNISDERPLLNYYRGVLIEEIDNRNDIDITSLGMEICNIIRRKVRRELFKEHYYSQREHKVTFTYDFDKSKEDIIKIEKMLFCYFDESFANDNEIKEIREMVKSKYPREVFIDFSC